MKQTVLLLIAAVAGAVTASAQFAVRGLATDTVGEPQMYATVRIYTEKDTTRAVATTVTEADGHFEQSLKSAGRYVARLSMVGCNDALAPFAVSAAAPRADVGTIVLRDADNMLEGVVVTAQRPLVHNEIDRIAYDVQADGDSKTLTAMDMLRKVPMVSVDGQENIAVRGSSNFVIYKNGRPDPMMSANPKDILKAIPASMIKKIEVITEPGAKYDAEGVAAILNIVMVEAGTVKGATGSVGAMVDNCGDVNGNGYLTAQYGKFITSINYGIFHVNRHKQHNFNDVEHRYTDTGNVLLQEAEQRGDGTVQYGNIEASYEPDSLNLLTFNFGGHYGNFGMDIANHTLMLSNAGTKIYGFDAATHMPDYGFFSFNGRFDYQHKTHVKDEALTLSYLISTTRNTENNNTLYSNIEGIELGYDEIDNDSRENFVEQTVQFDWTRPFAQYHKIETGAKYINRSNRSRTGQDFRLAGVDLEDLDTYSRLNHTTQVLAAYLSYTLTRGKWTGRAGLRYEYSRLSAEFPLTPAADYHRNLNDWVPSASINFQPDWANSLKVAFSTRIARPGITYLNPAEVEGPVTLSFGNPYLSSARNYTLSMTYMHIGSKLTFNISPSFDISNNNITAVKYVNDDGKEVSTYANTLRSRNLGLDGFVQWQAHANTSVILNGGCNQEWLESRDLGVKNSGFGGWFFVQVTQQLPWKLRATVNGGAWGGGVHGLYAKLEGMCWYGLSLQRSFLKEDRLTVRFDTRNPFSGKYSGYTQRLVQGDYTGYDRQKWNSRMFTISISYRFGSLNTSVKHTGKTIENTDVVGGVSQGGNTNGGQGQGQGMK